MVVYVALAAAFSSSPIFEGYDEIQHYDYVRWFVHNKSLPDPGFSADAFFLHPPMYYVLAAPLAATVDDADLAETRSRNNPFYGYAPGVAGNDNKNKRPHIAAEAFPYSQSGTARAVHLLRLLSIATGAGTVIVSYAIFGRLWPDSSDRRLAALGFVAFLPNFIYLSSVVTNDNLVILLTTVSLLLLLIQIRDGPTWGRAILLGVVLGGALLAEASSAILAIPVGLTMVLDRRAWRYAALTLGVVFAMAGWWYIRNWILYDDPTLLFLLLKESSGGTVLHQGGNVLSGAGWRQLGWMYKTFWARFASGGHVPVGPGFYKFFDGLSIVAVVGFAIWMVRAAGAARKRSIGLLDLRQPIVLGVFAMTWLGAVSWLVSASAAIQGRQLFPAIAVWGALLAVGLDTWTPRRLRLPVALGGVVVMAAVATISLFAYFLPAYRVRPAPATIENPLSYRYGEAAELIGIEPKVTFVRPGDTTTITLYWRAIEPTGESLWAYLNSVDSNVVRRSSLPGTGNLLSTHWEAGQTWREEYVVQIRSDAGTQVTYGLVAGLFEPEAKQNLPALDADGEEVIPFVGRIVIQGDAQPFEPAYRFGAVIGLGEPQITRTSDNLQVCLDWVSLAETATDYHVFIHVLDENGNLLTQRDFQPREGLYPTYVWGKGEALSECTTLDASAVPAQGWQVGIGLYDFASGERLPIQDAAGAPLSDAMILVEDNSE